MRKSLLTNCSTYCDPDDGGNSRVRYCVVNTKDYLHESEKGRLMRVGEWWGVRRRRCKRKKEKKKELTKREVRILSQMGL